MQRSFKMNLLMSLHDNLREIEEQCSISADLQTNHQAADLLSKALPVSRHRSSTLQHAHIL